MDDAFVNLEDISDEQTLERLESLFETTNNFPTLDSPNFSDENVINPSSSSFGGFGNASSSLGLSLDPASASDQDLFGSLVNLSSAPSSQSTVETGSTSTALPVPAAAVTTAPSFPSTKPAKATKSTAAFKSVTSSPQSHSVRTVTTPLSSPQGVILTSTTTAPSASATGVIQQGGQVLQIQLQPLSGVATTATPVTYSLASPLVTSSIVTLQSGKSSGTGKQQPHLLPKPTAIKSKPNTVSGATSSIITVASTAAGGVSFSTPITVTAQHQPLLINQGNVLTAGSTPLLINSFGQVMGQAGTAGSPIVIQQSNGSPYIVFRQSAATSTLLPIVTQSAAGTQQQQTIFLQQPAGATGSLITAQPQVKIITPQGRMQMQQIQTPTGPKLIAVPMGQGGTTTIFPQLTTLSAGQCQLLASPHGLVASMPTSVVTTLAPTATISSSIAASTSVVSTSAAAPSQLQHTTSAGLLSASDSSGKSKKKKKLKSAEGPSSDDKKQAKGLDLGELIKDVGLDLEGFGVDESFSVTQSGDGMLQSSDLTSPLVSMLSPDASGSQLVAQIQQPLPFQPSTSGQFQLVQGPDGQFVLQPAPTLYAHLSDGSGSATLSASGTTTILASPQLVMTTPTGTGSVVASASVPTSMTVTVAPPSALSPSKPMAAAAARACQETGRTPLFEDDRLPAGWRRKVSQRKSGASAGRYEVFIIGPGGKRFRSRNELKAYFEKTGEKNLDPEDFDFSTFGTGRSSSNRNEDNTSAFGFAHSVPGMAAGVSATLVLPTSVQLGGQSGLVEVTPKTEDALHPLTTDLLQSDISMEEETEHSQAPSLNSQLSRETADADAQISRLLETLQKNSSFWPVDKDIVKSLRECEETVASTSPSSPSASSAATTSAVFTSGTSGFQASFLSSLAGKAGDDAAVKKPQSPGLPTAAQSASNAQSVAGGATPTQMRALNNLPPNTRLIKGPNGQYTLQKVQTIELSPEMQQSLRAVQARIQEIEKQTVKTPQAEAELAQLQTRQQQILATGRPVATPPAALTQPIVVQQPQTSLSTATVVVASNQQSNFLTNTQSKPTAEIKTGAIRYTHNVGNQVISVAPPGSAGAQLAKPNMPNMPPLTDQQKRIVNEFKQKMALLPSDQHGQFIAQHKAQLIRQLNLQPNQLQALRSSQAPGGPILSLDADHQPSAAIRAAVIPTVVAAPTVISATTPGIARIFPIGVADGAAAILDATAIKRHATEPLSVDGTATGGFKHKKVAWVESQIKKDQNEAVNPNYKAPFRSKEDACKRLLRYHVFDELDTSPEEIEKADENFELKSSLLLGRYKTMLSKYHFLLLQESMRQVASSEEVMLARLWDSDERQTLIREREEFKAGKLCELPPLPDSWALKYKELCGVDPPQGIHIDHEEEKAEAPVPHEIILDQVHEVSNVIFSDPAQPESDSHPLHMQQKQSVMHPEIMQDPFQEEKPPVGGFVGLKFSRSVSGNWVSRREEAARQQRQREYDEHEAIKNELSGFAAAQASAPEPSSVAGPSRGAAHKVTFEQDDDSDQEFSLKDIDTAQAVGSILESGDSHDEDEEGDFDLHFDRYDTPMMEAGEADESVQSAINSILDLPQGTRIETPDLNNITGLLDSMDECDQGQNDQERDPVTEAAVNSIPQF